MRYRNIAVEGLDRFYRETEPYRRVLKTLDVHLFDTGHFTLETHAGLVAAAIREFLAW